MKNKLTVEEQKDYVEALKVEVQCTFSGSLENKKAVKEYNAANKRLKELLIEDLIKGNCGEQQKNR